MAIDTLGANALASDSVTTAKIAADAVTAAKIPAGAVVADIADGGIATAKLADDVVTGAKISDNSFMTDLWFIGVDRTMASSSCRLGFNDSTTWIQATQASHSGYAYGTLGTDKMSVSDDVFTFPATGVYRIDYIFNVISDASDVVIRGDINTTIDGSTFLDTAKQMIFNTAGSQTMGGSVCYNFRVSDTTTHKVRFTLDSGSGATIEGGGLGHNSVGPLATYVMFQRLGD